MLIRCSLKFWIHNVFVNLIGYVNAPGRYGFLISESNDVLVIDDDDLTCYEEVMSNMGSLKWHEAMKSKMDSMCDNKVWVLVKSPEEIKPIKCKWDFKRKTDIKINVVT